MKKITLEMLAQKIDSGFAKMEEKFEGVGQEFEKVYERFDVIDERFLAVDKRFDIMDKRFDNLEVSVKDRFFVVNDELQGQQGKVARIEKILKIG